MWDWGIWGSMMNPSTFSAWMPLMTAPNASMKWLTAKMSPLNPNLYMGWQGASIHPSSNCDLWKGFLIYPASTGAPNSAVTAATPWPATGYGIAPTTNIVNPFDPNTWSKIMTVPAPAMPPPR